MDLKTPDNQTLKKWLLDAGRLDLLPGYEVSESELSALMTEVEELHPQYNEEEKEAWAFYCLGTKNSVSKSAQDEIGGAATVELNRITNTLEAHARGFRILNDRCEELFIKHGEHFEHIDQAANSMNGALSLLPPALVEVSEVIHQSSRLHSDSIASFAESVNGKLESFRPPKWERIGIWVWRALLLVILLVLSIRAHAQGLQTVDLRRFAGLTLDTGYLNTANKALNVYCVASTCASGGSGGTSAVDGAAFTAGTTAFTPSGGFYKDAATAISDGNAATFRITANRALHVSLRNAAGTEIGTSGAPVEVNLRTVSSGAISSGAIASGAVASGAFASGSVASGAFAAGSIADGAEVTLGTKTDAKSTATDGTSTSAISILKEISAMEQAPAALATGTNSIGDVRSITTSITPGTAAGNLGKAEDAAHASADTGVMALAVQQQAAGAPTEFSATAADYSPIAVDSFGTMSGSLFMPWAWTYHENSSNALTDTTVHASCGTGLFNYIDTITFSTNAATAASILIEDSTNATILGPYYLEAVAGRGLSVNYLPGKKQTNSATLVSVTTTGAIAHGLDIQGHCGR